MEAHASHHSQLDRIYLSCCHLSWAHSFSVWLAPFSDHHLVTMTASLARRGWGWPIGILTTACWRRWVSWRPSGNSGQARTFYASLFSLDPTNPDTCRVLWDELPTVRVGDRDRLELPLTLAELLEAHRRMPTNKSPGMDGLTVELYRVFWDVLGSDLVTVWAESLKSEFSPCHAGKQCSPCC
ncbi:unnamed protein product [Lepidochelys kempii]